MTPSALQVVEQLANTVDVESGADEISAAAALGRWLSDRGIGGRRISAGELAQILELRTMLRATLLAHHDGLDDANAFDRISDLASIIPLHVDLQASPPTLTAARPGGDRLIAMVLDGVMSSIKDGTWMRLRICPADDCLVAFYDDSRGGTRRWCSMGVCGNRAKVQNFRQRQTVDRGR